MNKNIKSLINHKHYCALKSFLKAPVTVIKNKFAKKKNEKVIALEKQGYFIGAMNKEEFDFLRQYCNKAAEIHKLLGAQHRYALKLFSTRNDVKMFQNYFKDIAHEYLGQDCDLAVVELWSVPANAKMGAGYPKFHLDRGSYKGIHIFINIIDMPLGSGEPIVISKDDTDKFLSQKKVWGSEMVEDYDLTIFKKIHAHGRAGTYIIYDPHRVLHCGGRKEENKSRLNLVLSYRSKAFFGKDLH